jgi:hypothetical protein
MVTNGTMALLGLAGSVSATAFSGWIPPVLLFVSFLLIGRTFYVQYVRGVRTRASAIIAWCALAIVVGQWTWRLLD